MGACKVFLTAGPHLKRGGKTESGECNKFGMNHTNYGHDFFKESQDTV